MVPGQPELNTFLTCLIMPGGVPQLDLGGAEGRGETPRLWRAAVDTLLRRARPVAADWRHLVWRAAEQSDLQWLRLPSFQRNALRVDNEWHWQR